MTASPLPRANTATTNTATTDWLVDDSLAPTIEGELAPLYAGAQRGELCLPFCGSCVDLALELDQTACDRCGSANMVWCPVPLMGVVHSQTTVHRLEPGLIRTSRPYEILDIELPSTHRLLMTTTASTDAPHRIGDTVRIGFRRVGNVSIPAVVTSENTSLGGTS
jgi:uncharacterized protein